MANEIQLTIKNLNNDADPGFRDQNRFNYRTRTERGVVKYNENEYGPRNSKLSVVNRVLQCEYLQQPVE